ncbi:hypothetical protein [Nostoc parmelioides]|uniref:Chemotaxis protein n=1 Tax=Nostoc parmelioides FACHB-3921 TaxID=2692909 RepID=A0ABR8BMR0_9NOSO|nr:hypothetical protein [Nostoc parmelioides]MBD2255402.1 hypothetical protein [Nostoc parmelioides FACHB-3921]
MSKELTVIDLQEQAESYRIIAKACMNRRDILKARIKTFKEEEAPRENIKNLEDEILSLEIQIPELLIKASSLDAAEIVKVMTNLENAKQQIEATTRKVLEAVQKFNDTKEVFRVLSLFIRLGAAIINTTATGGTPAAQIASLVSEVDNLTRNL